MNQIIGRVEHANERGVTLERGKWYPWGTSVSEDERAMASGVVTLYVSESGVAQGVLPGYPSTRSAAEPELEALTTEVDTDGELRREAALKFALEFYAAAPRPSWSHGDVITTAGVFEAFLRGSSH